MEIWERRSGLDTTIDSQVGALQSEATRLFDHSTALLVEKNQLTFEIKSLKYTKNQLERLCEGRIKEDRLIEKEQEKWVEKKDSMELESLDEASLFLQKQCVAAQRRIKKSKNRQSKCADTDVMLQNACSENEQRQSDFQRLIEVASARAAIVKPQMEQQKEDKIRYFHARGLAFFDRKPEKLEHVKLMNLHLKMDILLRKINKNTKEWSEELHSDTTQGKILYLEGDEEYTDSHAAWARYDENKIVQLPECGFGDENLHDLEFLSILTAKNTHLEDMYAAFNKEKKEEEENHALEIPILQPEKGTKGGEDGTLQQLSNSARTLFDTEDPLLGLSQDARDNELKYMASDLAMRNLKEFTIDSNLILANNIHVDFTKAVSIFERALALGTAADLAGGRAHEHEEEALQLLPEYVPDSFNRINIQSSLGIVKGIVERLSSVIPTTVEHAKSEVIVEAETLQKVAIKCQYSLVEHVEISKTHTESEKNPVLDDIWMNACQTTLAEIGTLLAADITKGESLKAASEAAFSNFDKLLSMIKALHTTATEKCTLLDNQFTTAATGLSECPLYIQLTHLLVSAEGRDHSKSFGCNEFFPFFSIVIIFCFRTTSKD